MTRMAAFARDVARSVYDEQGATQAALSLSLFLSFSLSLSLTLTLSLSSSLSLSRFRTLLGPS